MELTETAEVVTWPEMHYVFVEKTGPIPQNAHIAWQEFHQVLAHLEANNKLTGFMSLYKTEPQIYRAGASFAAKPANLPAGVRYEKFAGGRYARFVLTGPHSELPAATGRAVQLVSERKIRLRDAYHIEHYLNDPRTTSKEKPVTEILFPVA
jgi:effector-binding domain-containing protein